MERKNYELRLQRARNSRRKRLIKRIAIVNIIAFATAALVLLTSFVGDKTKRDKVYTVYTVEYGDTLWDIARKEYGDTVDIRRKIYEIERNNEIVGGKIYPGMRLLVEMGS